MLPLLYCMTIPYGRWPWILPSGCQALITLVKGLSFGMEGFSGSYGQVIEVFHASNQLAQLDSSSE